MRFYLSLPKQLAHSHEVRDEVIEFDGGKGIGDPIFCKLHLDEEHRRLAKRCSHCEDFWCMNAE